MPVGTLSYGLQKRVELSGAHWATQPAAAAGRNGVGNEQRRKPKTLFVSVLDIRDELPGSRC